MAGVAAVLGVYAVVLGAALLPAEWLGRLWGIRALGLAGVALFGIGSLVCGLAEGIELLLVGRAVQALGGAALLVTAHAILVGDRGGRPDRRSRCGARRRSSAWPPAPPSAERSPRGSAGGRSS